MTTSNQALIIFARKPETGKVKTRLAATIGDAKALEVYTRLLLHTKSIAEGLDCDKYVFITEDNDDDFWQGFFIEKQVTGDLGERMQHAFNTLFEKGHKYVIIIGSDCPYLTTGIITEGFNLLAGCDIVIGPATDGGYYLLGMKQVYSALFNHKSWSTTAVFQQTVQDILSNNLNYHLLPQLTDVDEEKDIPADWR